jgi:hypothetical protein
MKRAIDAGNGGKAIVNEIFPKGEEIDVSNFSYLYYRYPARENVKIPQPLNLTVGDDGHKVTDAFGGEHFMPLGFFHVKYKVKGEQRERLLVEDKE